jgi:hypothetical protein
MGQSGLDLHSMKRNFCGVGYKGRLIIRTEHEKWHIVIELCGGVD